MYPTHTETRTAAHSLIARIQCARTLRSQYLKELWQARTARPAAAVIPVSRPA